MKIISVQSIPNDSSILPLSVRSISWDDFDRFCQDRVFRPDVISAAPTGLNLQYVEWGILDGATFAKNDRYLPTTDCIGRCASLLVVDQYLQHIVHAALNFDLDEKPVGFMKHMVFHLRALPANLAKEHGIDLKNATFYIVEGGNKNSSSAFNLYKVLREHGVQQDSMCFIPSRSNRDSENILLLNGVPHKAEGKLEAQIRALFPLS